MWRMSMLLYHWLKGNAVDGKWISVPKIISLVSLLPEILELELKILCYYALLVHFWIVEAYIFIDINHLLISTNEAQWE